MEIERLLPPLMSSVTTRGLLERFPPAWTAPAERGDKLRLGIPNTGKLRELVGVLAEGAYGCDCVNKKLFFEVSESLEVIRARSVDLPHLVARGIVDVGITGSDYVFESGEDLTQIEDLALITGRICLLSPSGEIPRPPGGEAFRIITQYPRHASSFRDQEGLAAEIFSVSGAGELYPQFGLSHASVDCVVTGQTARQNGLKIAAVIRPVTTGVYVRTAEADRPVMEAYREIVDRLVAVLRDVREREAAAGDGT
jgi:ATP phosphoribosyltransferase